MCTMDQSKDRQLQGDHKDYGVFVLIRYDGNLYGNMRNSIARNRSIISDYNGILLGISPEVTVECAGIGQWNNRNGVAVFEFDNVNNARKWCRSMPDINQSDFLFGIDVVIIKKNSETPKDKRFVALLDAHIKHESDFFLNFAAKESSKLRAQKDVAVAVGMDPKASKVKGNWDPDYTVLHFFKNKDAFVSHRNCKENNHLIVERTKSSDSDEITFEVKPI